MLIENSKTGAMEGMGIGWETIRKWNPYCVMVSSQLLGSRGAWSDWIGYGPSTQPIGGLVHLWNYDDQEFPAGSTSIFPDHLAGRLAAINALAMLHARERTQEGGARRGGAGGGGDGHPRRPALEGGPRARLGEAARQSQRARRAVGRLSVRGRAAVVRDHDPRRRRLAESGRGDRAPRVGGRPRARRGGRAVRRARRDRRAARRVDARAQQVRGGRAAAAPRRAVRARAHGRGPARGSALRSRATIRAGSISRIAGRMAFEGPAFRATGTQDVVLYQAPRLGEHTREICQNLLRLDDATIDRLIAEGALEVREDRRRAGALRRRMCAELRWWPGARVRSRGHRAHARATSASATRAQLSDRNRPAQLGQVPDRPRIHTAASAAPPSMRRFAPLM